MEEKEAMKNKVVRKLLMVGLSSSVVLTSTVGVTAASMDTAIEAGAEDTVEDETLTPVVDEDALAEEDSEDVAEEETTEEETEETTDEAGEEETEETTADVVLENCTVIFVDENGTEIGSGSVTPYDCANGYYICRYADVVGVPEGKEILGGTGDFSVSKNQRWIQLTLTDKAETPEHTAKTVQINYQLENGTSVGKGSITVEPQYTEDKTVYYNFNYSQLTDVPEGYEIAVAGDCNVTGADQVNVTVKKVKAENRTVFVSFEDEETGKILPDVAAIQIANDATQFNTSLVTVPEGYELCRVGDVDIDANSNAITLKVRKTAPEYKTVYVSFIDENTKFQVGDIQSIEVGAKDTIFNTSKLTAPNGYEICNVGDVYVGEGDTVNVEVREIATTRTVYVSFIDEETKQPLENGIQAIEIDSDATYFNTNLLTAPEGWVLCNVGDVYLGTNDTVNVEVRKADAETRTIYVSLVTESGDVISPNQEIEIAAEATTFHTSCLAVPKGYELCQVGDMYIGNGDTMNVFVREAQVVTDKNVIVSYVDENNKNVGTQDLVVGVGDTYVNTSKLNVPYGYELVNVGDLAFDTENTLTVQVRAKEYTKDVVVDYVDEDGNPVLTTTIKVDEDATYFNTNILTDVPYGWIIAVVGDIPINDNNTATVVVRQKTYTKDVAVNYVDANGTTIAASSVTLEDTATYFNTSILTGVPEGWEIANIGDVYVGDADSVDVLIRETVKREKDIIISYVDEKDGHEVAVSSITIDEDASYFNTSLLTDVPEGWTLAEVGDIYLGSSTVAKVKIRKTEAARTKDIIVSYIDEKDEHEVAVSSITIDEDASYFNTSLLTDVPEGWELCEVGDIYLGTSTVAKVKIRQVEAEQRNIAVKYVTEDGTEVGAGALTVEKDATYINTSVLTDVPEGYVIAIVGDLPIENETVVVTVRAEKEDPEEPTPTPDPENPTPTPNPEDPDQPVDPEDPDQPTDPDQNKPTVAPEKPNNDNQNNDQDKADTNKSEVKTNNPKTGDATNTVPLVAGLLGSGSMIGLIQMLRRKKK